MAKIIIDGSEMQAGEGMTVLEAARENGINIPSLCYHKALRPIGACKICVVEALSRTGTPAARLSCILKVRDGLVVKTRSDLVSKSRARAFRNLLAMAPQSKRLLDLAEEYGVDVGPPPDGCLRCRLCIRVCKEIVGPGALRMEKRDGKDFVVPLEGLCIGCGTCVNLCPTGAVRLEDRAGTRTISIREEVIGIHPLERCEACGAFFASRKFLRHVEEEVTRGHPDVKDHHHYCPTCAKLFSGRIKSFSRLRSQ